MSDRLPELRRQRALVAEHLAWLDREIAAAGGEVPPPPAAPPRPAGRGFGADLPSAEKILADFRNDAERSPSRMRQGCLWSFVAGLALMILGIFAIYWLGYR